MQDSFQAKDYQKTLTTSQGEYVYYDIQALSNLNLNRPESLPYSIRILLESALRNHDEYQITFNDIKNILSWSPDAGDQPDIAYKPGRVILQDFTGVPCVVDLAAMREALKHLGGDYKKINPQVQCDLVIDHSVQVDAFGHADALAKNVELEFERNQERYEFLKWGQKSFENFSVVPPATGIVHQVNLEYLAKGVLTKTINGQRVAYPDSLVGTDSHTTMINGLGILGWGVGGIEAEAVMLGEPIYMLRPEVIGFKLTGQLAEGVTATDLVLTVTQMLRAKGVVGKFVEFYGPGLKHLSLPDRATISNMAPEYGATVGIFPVDDEVLAYLRLTGRREEEVELVERYMKTQGLFYTDQDADPQFTDTLTLDMSTVVASLAGPKRPQDRIALTDMKKMFDDAMSKTVQDKGFGVDEARRRQSVSVVNGSTHTLHHGSVVIAAITSCTNTSNPSVLIAAGLVAQKAAERGLTVPGYVKTSFAPGSQVVEEYIRNSGLMPYFEQLGFHIVGYGCTTCIGNSGPLPDVIAQGIQEGELVAASVLSGNRNFEGRVNPHVKANYLASPPLVVAFALAGRVDIDLEEEPIGQTPAGDDVFLKDIWPTQSEIKALIDKHVTAEAFKKRYANVSDGNTLWNAIPAVDADLYEWKSQSTYIQNPPFFTGMTHDVKPIEPITGARVLVKVGDSITTDHISPAGAIAEDSPAGRYLMEQGVALKDFNSYGSRRGNDRVMTRGTFANIRLRNQLAPGTEGSWTVHFPSGDKLSIYDAAQRYGEEQVPLMVLAGKEYGTGSSRDWAAKGTALLGVKAVLAQSYERIHRSNLAGMGVIPLQFKDGQSAESLGLTGEEVFDLGGINDHLKPQQDLALTAVRKNGETVEFTVTVRLDTPVEVDYVRNGGILQTVLRKLA
jgi:aconitate hydratase